MIDYIVFDLDGTLVDSAHVCAEILSQMLADRGSARMITSDEATPYLSKGGTYMIAGLLGDECRHPAVDLDEFRHRYANLQSSPPALYNGVRTGLETLLDHGYGLAICSNKPQNLCEKVLRDADLADHFDTIVGTEAGRRPKPHRDLIDVTLSNLNTRADRCVFVGDSELDYFTAEAADMPFLFVSYGYCSPDWSSQGCSTFDRFPDLVDAITSVYRRTEQVRRVA